MSKMNRGWLIVAAALAVGASSAIRAGDGGAGGDSGDNGMNPMYGDSYAVLEGQGHNAGITRIAPEGAFAAHEMDGQKTPLMDQMRQTQSTIAARTRAAADRMRAALSPNTGATSTSSSTPSTSATVAAPAPASAPKLTGSTSAPSAAGPVVVTPTPDIPAPAIAPSQPSTDSGYRVAPVNPRGQAPTIVGPSS